MRASSAVFILAAAATVAPAFAAPVSSSFSRRQTTATPDDSDAISLGTIGTIFSLGAPVVSGIIDHFKNNGQQRRELMDLLARAEVDESGALKLGDAADIASIGSSVVSVFHNLFGGNNGQQRREELMEILARAEAEADDSGAIKLGNVADIASIGSSVVSAFSHLFGGSSDQQQQRRDELEALFARAQNELDESGAISFDTIKNIGSIGGSAISILHNIFGGSDNQRRDVADDSGAIKLGNVADIASIGSSVVSAFSHLFGGSSDQQQQRRDEIEALFARAQNELDESGAISFDTIKNIGSIGGSAISILHNIFGGSDNQQRDVADDSGAIKLGNVADIASIGSSVVSAFSHLFGGSGDQQQQRRDELEALFARAQNELDESGAISFDTIKNIGSIGGSAISILHNIFGGSDNQQRDVADDSGAIKLGNVADIASIGSSVVSAFSHLFGGNSDQQQRREFEELLARQTTGLSQSDAISLGTIGTIFSLGAPVVGGIIDHFKNNGNQRREFEELLARGDTSGALSTLLPIIHRIPLHIGVPKVARQTDVDQSDAISLGTLGTIFSLGAPVVGGIIDHFKNGNQQQRREMEDVLARADESGSLSTLLSLIKAAHPVSQGPVVARQQTSADQSDAISLGTLGTIFSLGAPVVGGIIDHFKNGNQQQRRAVEELMARRIPVGLKVPTGSIGIQPTSFKPAASLNDLD